MESEESFPMAEEFIRTLKVGDNVGIWANSGNHELVHTNK